MLVLPADVGLTFQRDLPSFNFFIFYFFKVKQPTAIEKSLLVASNEKVKKSVHDPGILSFYKSVRLTVVF